MRIVPYQQLPAKLRHQIENGVTNTVCPKCGGGRSGEASLSIRGEDQAGTLSLKCFRASCGWYAKTNGSGYVGRDSKPSFTPRQLDAYTEPLDDSTVDYLCAVYGLSGPVILARGWRQLQTKHLAIPILDRTSRQLGHITRTLESPKRVSTYRAVNQPLLDVWYAGNGNPTIVVEDCISAARLFGLGYNAVSILGTNITVAQAKEIALTAAGGPVILALDRDAFDKALDLSRKLQHVVRMRPVCLYEDIKDMVSDRDIIMLIEGVTGGRTKANRGDSTEQAAL